VPGGRHPPRGLAAIAHGKHIVMVNVEGPMRLAPGRCWPRRANAAGVVYSLAWGDQPALICEHVGLLGARLAGFKVVGRRQGPRRYEPALPSLDAPTRCGRSSTSICASTIAPRSIRKMFQQLQSTAQNPPSKCRRCATPPASCRRVAAWAFPPASRFELADVCKPKARRRRRLEQAGRHRGRVVGHAGRRGCAATISRSVPMW